MVQRVNTKGYTLVELMIVVAIIGILAAISAGKVSDVMRRAQEARTKGNLAILRSSITVYHSNTEGIYPSILEDLTTGPSPILSQIPLKFTPTYHPEGNSVTNGGSAGMTDARRDWYYFNDPTEPAVFGNVVVNCIHGDLKGNAWSSY